MGGVLGVWWIARSHFLTYADLIAVGLPLGQAIGRLGNWANYELFGLPTNLPWGIAIPSAYRPAGYESVSHFHPLFLYESLGSLVLFWILSRLIVSKSYTPGYILGWYLVGYSVIRISLEPLRIGNWHVGAIATATLVGMGSLLVGIWLVWRSRIRI
jgi:phosphatidylglycerol:prolipoprotein diacylglycerol transferase